MEKIRLSTVSHRKGHQNKVMGLVMGLLYYRRTASPALTLYVAIFRILWIPFSTNPFLNRRFEQKLG